LNLCAALLRIDIDVPGLDEICIHYNREPNLEVRKAYLDLITARAHTLPNSVNDTVRMICAEMRAMDKEMRIYGCQMLAQLEGIPERTVI